MWKLIYPGFFSLYLVHCWSTKRLLSTFQRVCPGTWLQDYRWWVFILVQLSTIIDWCNLTGCMSPNPRDPECEIDDPPGNLTDKVWSWLKKNCVSVDLFANEIIHASQGRVSSLLNNPPTAFPARTGREPWEKMRVLKRSNATRVADLFSERCEVSVICICEFYRQYIYFCKRSKAGFALGFGLVDQWKEAITPRQSYFRYSILCTARKRNVPDTNLGDCRTTKKARKTFAQAELASLDAVFLASKGLPSAMMLEHLTASLGLDKIQVGAMIHLK